MRRHEKAPRIPTCETPGCENPMDADGLCQKCRKRPCDGCGRPFVLEDMNIAKDGDSMLCPACFAGEREKSA